jgi:hypothetical protein
MKYEHLLAYLKGRFMGWGKMPSFTKKGPGRKHSEIKKDRHGNPITRWIPRQEEKSSFRRNLDGSLKW